MILGTLCPYNLARSAWADTEPGRGGCHSVCSLLPKIRPATAHLSGLVSAAFKLTPDKTTPHLIWLPDRIQITLCLRNTDALVQHAMKKHKGRNSLVGGAMHKHAPALERRHHPAKGAKI